MLAGIGRWRGAKWEPVGGGMIGLTANGPVFTGGVYSLVRRTGARAVFAGGVFTEAGLTPARHAAMWDGSRWSRVGVGFNRIVSAIEPFDDGGGPNLYAGGEFTAAGGAVARGVARWNGQEWQPVGEGLLGATVSPFASVMALQVYDDGTGPALFAGGRIGVAGRQPTRGIAKWDGRLWSAFTGGIVPGASNEFIDDLEVLDDGLGDALYASGSFGSATPGVARYFRGSWTVLGHANDAVVCLRAFDEGEGARLFAGGWFSTMAGEPLAALARWSGGGAWSAVGGPLSHSTSPVHPVWGLEVYDDGGGNALYVSGVFDVAGGVPVQSFAKWDGSTWSSVGLGQAETPVGVLRSRSGDAGDGPAIFVGGAYPVGSGQIGLGVGSWDGALWRRLGLLKGATVTELETFDDGSGPALFVAGDFRSVDGVPSFYFAKWKACPSCYPDCNGDGQLTVNDFACFQARFVGGSPSADCDNDGSLTVADFGCFQTRFVAGCP